MRMWNGALPVYIGIMLMRLRRAHNLRLLTNLPSKKLCRNAHFGLYTQTHVLLARTQHIYSMLSPNVCYRLHKTPVYIYSTYYMRASGYIIFDAPFAQHRITYARTQSDAKAWQTGCGCDGFFFLRRKGFAATKCVNNCLCGQPMCRRDQGRYNSGLVAIRTFRSVYDWGF